MIVNLEKREYRNATIYKIPKRTETKLDTF